MLKFYLLCCLPGLFQFLGLLMLCRIFFCHLVYQVTMSCPSILLFLTGKTELSLVNLAGTEHPCSFSQEDLYDGLFILNSSLLYFGFLVVLVFW